MAAVKYILAGLSVFVGIYLAVVVLYSTTGMGRPHAVAQGQPSDDGTTVTFDIQQLQSVNGVLTGDLTVAPGPELVDPVRHGLREDFSVAVTSAGVPSKRFWSRGQVPDPFPVRLSITGDPSSWPFDRYDSGPISVEIFRGGRAPQRASVTFFDRIPGWKVDVFGVSDASLTAPYRLVLHRSPSTAAFSVVIIGALIALAGQALFVAIQTVSGRREFQPWMTTWCGVLLFSVVPLRNALPDAPPVGFWVDITIILWLIAVLVTSNALCLVSWWRHTRPGVEQSG